MSASAAQGGKEAKAGKSKLVPILLVVILLLLAGGGGGGYFLYKRSSQPAVAVVPPPVFFALDPFTVNLASDPDSDSDSGDHYLHLGLTLKIGSAAEEHKLTEYLPEIRSHILLLLSSKKPSDLATVAGKQKLSDELRATIAKTFEHESNGPKVSGVLLTDFVIQ